jgi:hypothetical protein
VLFVGAPQLPCEHDRARVPGRCGHAVAAPVAVRTRGSAAVAVAKCMCPFIDRVDSRKSTPTNCCCHWTLAERSRSSDP